MIRIIVFFFFLLSYVNGNYGIYCRENIEQCQIKLVKELDEQGDVFCCVTLTYLDCLKQSNCSTFNNDIPPANHSRACEFNFETSGQSEMKYPNWKCSLVNHWKLLAILIVAVSLLMLIVIGYCCCKCVVVCMILPKNKIGEAILDQKDRRMSFDY